MVSTITVGETVAVHGLMFLASLLIGGCLASLVLMCSGKYLAAPYDGEVDKDKPWVVRYRPMHEVIADRVLNRVAVCVLGVFNLLLYIWLYAMYVVGG